MMLCIFGGFKANKLKKQLRMAITRLQIASNKKSSLLKQNMRATAALIAKNPYNEEKALVNAEYLLRDENLVEVYDFLMLNCEILIERIKLIEVKKKCPSDLLSCVSTLIYAAPRLDNIPELVSIRKLFRAKYGNKFDKTAANNAEGIANDGVVTKLSLQPLDGYQVQTYLKRICEQFDVDWPSTITPSSDHISPQTINIDCQNIHVYAKNDPDCIDRSEVAGTNVSVLTPNTSTNEEPTDHFEDASSWLDNGALSSSLGEDKEVVQNDQIMIDSIASISPKLPIRIFRPNPSLEIAFDVRTRNPVYVMEKLDGLETSGSSRHQQRPRFYEERALPEEYRSRLHHYRQSGFDRGHMAPAADFKDSMDDTFNLCNVSPQVHSMNISIWAKLEHFCRAVAKREKKECDGITYVVTGPLWLPAKQTSEKRFEYNYSAIGRPSSLVHVPTHFFKVVVVVAEDTIRKFACFVVPNTEEDQTKALLEDYVVDFADLETVSGLQFFPSMTAEEGWRERASTITDKVRSNRSKSSFPALTDMTSSKLGWNKSSSSITLKHLCEVG